ncbi:Calmodulin-binding transcription activator 2, partial [Striga hermonthica]
EVAYKQGSGCFLPVRAKSQAPNNEARPFYTYHEQEEQSLERNIQTFPSNEETDIATNPNLENGMTTIGNGNYSLIMKKPLGETLKKVDSFSSWIASELGEVDDLDMQSSDAILWSTMGIEYEHNMAAQLHVDTHMLNPSISFDQLFSISDFLPNWAYSNLETK